MTIHSKIMAVIIFAFTSTFAFSQNNLLNKRNLKSVNNAIEDIFEEIPEYNYEKIDSISHFETLKLKTKNTNEQLVYVILAQAKGRRNYFDFMVIYTDKVIQHIEILQYRSSHGYQITSKSWLKDFTGLTAREEIQIGRQVDAISGATLSSYGLLKTLNEINKLISNLP